jgi:signal transduction histidine kinase
VDALVAAAIHDAKNALAALGTALDEAARVSAQLVELLAIYRDRQGTLRLAVEDHHLGDFIDETLEELDLPGDSALELVRDDAAAGEIGVWAFDAYLVRCILLDALRNALRHAGRSVRLGVAREPGGGVRFTVADDGPGFPAATLRGEAAVMTNESSGLGLVFARLVAERHAAPGGRHGRIELANDGGARFALVLP